MFFPNSQLPVASYLIRLLLIPPLVFFALLSACAGGNIFPDIGTNLANPSSMAVDSAAGRLYLVNSNNKVLYKTGSFQALDISDPAAPKLIGSVNTDSFSGHIYLDTAAGYAYLTNRYSTSDNDKIDNILRINVNEAGGGFLAVESFEDGANPFGLTLDASTARLYTATSESSVEYFPVGSPQSITTVSLANLNLSDGSILASSQFRDIAIIGRQAFLTRPSRGVIVFDLDEENADYFISDFTSPRAVVSDGTYVYLADVEVINDEVTPLLYVIDPSALPPVAGNGTAALVSRDDPGVVKISVGVGSDKKADPQEILLTTDYIFVTNMGNNSVSVINRSDFSRGADIAVGEEPFGMAVYSPAGADTHLFVTNFQANSISVIDLPTLSVAATYQ